MSDILYVTGTVAFFSLMLAYVSLCARLGRNSENDTVSSETRP